VSRAVVAVVAVAVIAWLGVMELNVRRQADGLDAAQRRAFAAADADFRAARTLNPSTAPDVSRAFLYARNGRRDRAAALLKDVVRREPDNLTAWGVLYSFTKDDDPATAARALAARRRLDPVSARGG
jgi:predicted Zn-dependent protease